MFKVIVILISQHFLMVLAFTVFFSQSAYAAKVLDTKVPLLPDTILINGNIITADSDIPDEVSFVEALAIHNGKIIAVGNNAEIRSMAVDNTETLDLRSRTVVPGMIDTHNHLYTTALGFPWARDFDPQLLEIRLSVESEDHAVELAEAAVKARARQLGPGKWIFVGIRPSNIAHSAYGDLITRSVLDEWAPENPVKLGTRASMVINTLGIEGVENYFGSKIPDAYWAVDAELGWGRQYADFGRVTQDIVASQILDKYAALFKSVLQVNAQAGVTTHATHAHTKTGYTIGKMLDQAGELPIRWAWSVGWGHIFNSNPEEFFNRLPDFTGYGSDYLWSLGINMVSMDGGAIAMCTTIDAPDDIKARERCPDNDAGGALRVRSLRAALRNGIKVAGHHIGGDRALDYYQEEVANSGLSLEKLHSLRLVSDHCHQVRQDQIQRAKRFGQTFSCDASPEVNDVIIRDYGEEYLTRYAPFKSMLDAGIRPIISQFGDQRAVNGRPFQAGYMFITRRSLDGEFPIGIPEEAIPDRMTMLLMMTRWAAFPLEREDLLGSLEPGKFADLVVIDKDVLDVPLEELPTIRPILTMVQGQIVFEDPEFRGNILRFNTETEQWEKDLKSESSLWRW